ncbi:MAG: MBL fold metallo-hydrolase [Desulfarculaceae bacterium]|nr:MBL fold metallo-hydrolase [Desulfarculaceae bacterium]MCF8046084.1 MBL fold metallo-hydrolase [Desulfarculaceae bacterium]MCF8064802.1 MBL fold metallo-hydrolase [Desulfarculaceae bacterium]MCF8098992.1 MBL fold metallo-hydrolase [Desulfarculaceae bacterium]MCF8121256.1 MBL fold metallo-hydrolase [Desulfarculaceae bacterium]
MKLTLLTENNSLFCKFYFAEHGFSAFIEDEGKTILYDTGYSNAFILNAEKMGFDLTAIDYLILSHGHYDHTGGLKHLIDYYKSRHLTRKPVLKFTSEVLLLPKYNFEIDEDQGTDVDIQTLEQYFDIQMSEEVEKLTSRLYYLGKVARDNDFECRLPQVAKKKVGGEWVEDLVDEDTQLAFLHGDNQVSVITGCSHNGICNIMAYAKQVTKADKINTAIGGLHLQAPPKDLMQATMDFVQDEQIDTFYACHCCDFKSRIALSTVSNVEEAGVGLELIWE